MADILTIAEATRRIQTGDLTPSELLEQCLSRVDRVEAEVRAWAHLDRERARLEAAECTRELASGRYRGPLHGIPIGIKDIIDVFDMPTGCGSQLWAGSYARHDAECVRRLRDAGAVIVGKTVTTSYAYLDPPVTRNPWNLARTPGGSSSGSAAAVASGMCLAALGSQTGGSVIRPASYCGVYALKPTWNRISTSGVLPLAPSLDHIGIFARSLADLAVVFGAITEEVMETKEFQPILQPLGEPFLDGTDEVMMRFDESARALGQSVRQPLPKAFQDIYQHHRVIMSHEAAQYHGNRWRRRPTDYPPRIAELIQDGLGYSDLEVQQARSYRETLTKAMQRDSDLVMLTPSTTDLAPTPETTGNPRFNSPWSFLRKPVITIPTGLVNGLPTGLQLIGSAMAEADLFSAARWIEARLPFRMPADA